MTARPESRYALRFLVVLGIAAGASGLHCRPDGADRAGEGTRPGNDTRTTTGDAIDGSGDSSMVGEGDRGSGDEPWSDTGASGDGDDSGDTAASNTPTPVDAPWPDDTPLPEAFDFPPWLTMPESGTIVVSWRTNANSTGVVYYGDTPSHDLSASTQSSERLHHVELTSLLPATTYWYEVTIDGSDARRQGVFTTPGADSFRFIHLGEFHAPSHAAEVALFTETVRAFRPHLIIESGDMCDDGNELDHWRSYLRTSAPWISNIILLPTGSNHVDGWFGNAHLKDLFVLPNNERWYTTRYGPVQFFNLDSTYAIQSIDVVLLQPTWLAEELGAAHDGVDDPTFVIAAWHYPACSSSYSSRADARSWVHGLFVNTFRNNGGVDLVLTGHDKYYERSDIVGGIMHVQSNVGNLSPGQPGDNHEDCTPLVTNTETHSLVLFTVEGNELWAEAVNELGEQIDSFSILR